MSDVATQTSPLDKLHDVIIIEQVSAWPPAPIWYIVLMLVLGLLAALYIYLKKLNTKNKYLL